MEFYLIALVGVLNVLCFVVGAKVCQAVSKGEKIETLTLNPVKAYQERQDKKQAEKTQDRIDTIMRNIDVYDGTSKGQEDVPKG